MSDATTRFQINLDNPSAALELDLQTNPDEEGEQQKELTMLPEIKGRIKNVKQLLMDDLIADGVFKRKVPFSSSRWRNNTQVYSARQLGMGI